jgi:hypothetical protein
MSVFLRGLGTSDAVVAGDTHETVSHLSPFLSPKDSLPIYQIKQTGQIVATSPQNESLPFPPAGDEAKPP